MNELIPISLSLPGLIYCINNLVRVYARALKLSGVDPSHDYQEDEPRLKPPGQYLVNRPYHLRHHSENPNFYHSGVLTLGDKLAGTALALKGKTVTITGANSVLGEALIEMCLALEVKQVVALVRRKSSLPEALANHKKVEVRQWTVGEEYKLSDILSRTTIAIAAHGIKLVVNSSKAIAQAQEVNVNSVLRLYEVFSQTVITDLDIAQKEFWAVTSLAELTPVKNYIAYETSKRQLGRIISTSLRHKSPCIIRKIILDGFESPMSPGFETKIGQYIPWIAFYLKRDRRNVLVCRSIWRFLWLNLLLIWQETLYFWLYR